MTAILITTVRVWVPDAWDVVELETAPATTVSEVKASALLQAVGSGTRADPANFIVKFRGALINDETVTLESLGVPDKGPMIVLPARRRPVV